MVPKQRVLCFLLKVHRSFTNVAWVRLPASSEKESRGLCVGGLRKFSKDTRYVSTSDLTEDAIMSLLGAVDAGHTVSQNARDSLASELYGRTS